MQQIYPYDYFTGFRRVKKLSAVTKHPYREVIEERIKIINFFDKYGHKVTREAFGVSRSTVFLWKKRLKEGGGKAVFLAPASRAPKRRRRRETHHLIVSFIQEYRRSHPGVGKECIKPLLDSYCEREGIPSISESTIGRVIADLKRRGVIPSPRVSFYARQDRFVLRPHKRRKKLRRGSFKPERPGDVVQMDSITIFHNNIKRYLLTAVDLTSRFAFAYTYSSLSSLNGADFMDKLKKVSPFTITRIQTDNGGEFEHHFRDYIERNSIIHFHNYPKKPQSNSCVERFNRTLREQHVRWNTDDLYDIDSFNQGLMDYLLWYNTEKPHKTLNKAPPLRYYVDTFLNPEESNMLWTSTRV